MGRWQWAIADHLGTLKADAVGFSRSIKFTRNLYPEAKVTLDLEAGEAASDLLAAYDAGTPLMYCWRQEAGAQVLRASLFLDATEEAAGDTATIATTFRGPFARLLPSGNSQGRLTGAAQAYVSQYDQFIMRDLVVQANATSPTQLSTPAGAGVGTYLLSPTYNYASVGQSIIDLTNISASSPEFDVSPLAPPSSIPASPPDLGSFTIAGSAGPDATAVAGFEHGGKTRANVQSFRRQTTRPVNKVYGVGGGGAEQGPFTSPAADITARGMSEAVANTSYPSRSLIADAAHAIQRANPVEVYALTVDPSNPNAPDPFVDYDIRSLVSVRVRRGALSVDAVADVNAIEITLDDEGNEIMHTVEVAVRGT